MTEEYAESMNNLPPLPGSPQVVVTPDGTRLSPPRAPVPQPTPTRLPPIQPITQAGVPRGKENPTQPQLVQPAGMLPGWYLYQPGPDAQATAPWTIPPPVLEVETPEQVALREAKAKQRKKLFISLGTVAIVLLAVSVLVIYYFWWSGHTDHYWESRQYDY